MMFSWLRRWLFPHDLENYREPVTPYTHQEIMQVLGHAERMAHDPNARLNSTQSMIMVLIRIVRQQLRESEWRDYP